jgi:hypothetical protein
MKQKIFSILAVVCLIVIPAADSYAQTASALLPTGTLVHAVGDDTIYYIDNNTKRPIDSLETFRLQGFHAPIIVMSAANLALYPTGDFITEDSTLVFPGQADVMPDLAPFAPKDLQLVNRNGRLLLLFTTEFWNKGKGPFELDATSTKPIQDNYFETAERIILPNGSVRNKVVGNLFWHEIHKHFHYDDFASYVLEMIPPQGPTVTPPVITPPMPAMPSSMTPSLPGLAPISAILGVSTVAEIVINQPFASLNPNISFFRPKG